MTATSPVDSIWTRKTMRLCRLSSLVTPPWCHLVVPAGCPIASCHPLIVPPSLLLVAPAGCHFASCHPLSALPYCCLVAPADCCIASPCPLVAPLAALSSSHFAGLLLPHLSTRRPLFVSSSRRAASRCLVAPAGCRAIISLRPLVAPTSCPPSCWVVVALPVLLPPSCPLVFYSITDAIKHRRMLLPPSNTTTTAAIERRIHRCHSCRPSPLSNANARLCPSPPSNADAHHRHPPLLMSFSIVTSPSPISTSHRCCRRTLQSPLNAPPLRRP